MARTHVPLEYQWVALARREPFCEQLFLECLRATGIYSLWLLMLVSWNLDFGPRCEETRRKDLRSRLMRVYTRSRPQKVPLFMAMAHAIIEELERYGIMRFERDGDVLEQLWSFACGTGIGVSGYKLDLQILSQ